MNILNALLKVGTVRNGIFEINLNHLISILKRNKVLEEKSYKPKEIKYKHFNKTNYKPDFYETVTKN